MKNLLVGMFAVALSTGAWAYTASDYSQDGLLHQWDAIANVNAYTHDASAMVWKDLAGGLDDVGPIDLRLTANGSWGDNWLNVNGCSATGLVASAAIGTIEVVYRMTENDPDVKRAMTVISTGRNPYVFVFYNYNPTTFWMLSQMNYSWQKKCPISYDANDHVVALEPAAGFYLDNVSKGCGNIPSQMGMDVSPAVTVGSATIANAGCWTGRVYAVRFYNRKLSTEEIVRHYMIDRARFFGTYPAKSIGVTANDERFGNPQPGGYGAWTGLTIGESYTFTSAQFATNATVTAAAECDGWELYHQGAATPFRTSADAGEDALSCTVEFTGDEVMKWLWKGRSYRVKATGLHATPSVSEVWVKHGESVTLTATPEAGYAIAAWDGDINVAGATLTLASVENAFEVRACGVRSAPTDAERVVYVSQGGSDGADGSTWSGAYKSPEVAVAALADETRLTYVLVAPGIYRTTAQLSLAGPIRVVGAGADETILDGGLGGWRGAVVSHDQAGVYDLTLRRYQRKGNGTGVSMSKGEVRRCVLRDCHTNGEEEGWDSGHGGGASVSGGVLADSEITACTTEKGHGKGNALYVSGSAVVTNCDIHANNNGYPHSSMTEGAGGVYMLGGTLVACKVRDNYRGSVGGIWAANANAKVVNCLITGNTAASNGAGVYMSNGQLVNCTVYGNVLTADASGYSGVRLSGGSAKNNIIWGNGPAGTPGGSCSIASGKTFDHNVIDVAIAAYPDNYVSDPKFVDAAADDFRIAARSSDAYANADASVAPSTDIVGVARDAEKPDIGAYAYDALIEAYGVSLKLGENFPIGTNVLAEAIVSGADAAACTFSWTLDGELLAGETGTTLDLAGLSAGRHAVAVAIDSVRGKAAATNTIAVKPYAVFVNTTGSGTFPYDTVEKGTNSLEEAYAALWRDMAHTSVVTVAAGAYSLTGQILMNAPVRVVGAGRDETVFTKAFDGGRCFLLSNPAALVTDLAVCGGTSGGAFSVSSGCVADCDVRSFRIFSDVYGIGAAVSGGSVVGCLFEGITNNIGHTRGGGVCISGGIVSNCIVRACAGLGYWAEPYGGGGVYMEGGTLVDSRIENCGFAGNSDQPGSALRVYGDGVLVDRCVISGSRAAVGAVCQLACAHPNLMPRSTVRNTLICGNTGSIIVHSSSTYVEGQTKPLDVDLVNVTVGANVSTSDNAIFGGKVLNSILDSEGTDWTIADAVVVSNTCCAALVDGENGNVTGDPLFKKPAKGNFRLRAGSPCLNSGDPSLYAATPDATDLEGNPRVHKGKVHMGCYQNLNKGLLVIMR